MEMEVEENNNNSVVKYNKNFENNSENSSSCSLSISPEAVEEIIQTARRSPPLPRSKLIKQLSPQHPDRLYYKILRAAEVNVVIHYWLNEYRKDKDSALRKLYQLHVDLSAYQHINVETFLGIQGNDINELIPYLERSRNSILSGTGTYFLIIRNKGNVAKIKKIEEFIENFVAMCAKEKIIYEFDLIKKLIRFLVQMANSCKRPIKHTGVHIALKHQSGLIKIGEKINKKIGKIQKMMEPENTPEVLDEFQSKIEKLKNYDCEINQMIIYLQDNIFNKNWNFMDPKLQLMRLECILELYNWITIFPKRHLHNENLNFILNAMVDQHKCVRYAAIGVIGRIIENFEPLIHAKLLKIVGPIANQIRDIDYNVSILAVDTIKIIRRYISIPSDIREVLCKTVYCLHYPLAAAAGRYLVDFIRDKIEDNDDEGLLGYLMTFERKAIQHGIHNHHPFVIEAVYDCCPVLQNVSVFMKVFKCIEACDELTRNIWLDFLTESVKLTFTGKSSLKRDKQLTRMVHSIQVNKMKKELFRNLIILLDNFEMKKLVPLLILMRDHGEIVADPESVADLNQSIADAEAVVDLDQPSVSPDQSAMVVLDQPAVSSGQSARVDLDQPAVSPDQSTMVDLDQPAVSPDQSAKVDLYQPAVSPDQSAKVDLDQSAVSPDQSDDVVMSDSDNSIIESSQ